MNITAIIGSYRTKGKQGQAQYVISKKTALEFHTDAAG
jgi:hypothetical protein